MPRKRLTAPVMDPLAKVCENLVCFDLAMANMIADERDRCSLACANLKLRGTFASIWCAACHRRHGAADTQAATLTAAPPCVRCLERASRIHRRKAPNALPDERAECRQA